jgi:hypothetical protein
VNSHPHGSHECYCPDSGYTEIVDAGIPCRSLRCPGSGQPMRATQTGEYRGEYHIPPGSRVAYPIAQDEGGSVVKKVAIAVGAIILLAAIIKSTRELRVKA